MVRLHPASLPAAIECPASCPERALSHASLVSPLTSPHFYKAHMGALKQRPFVKSQKTKKTRELLVTKHTHAYKK